MLDTDADQGLLKRPWFQIGACTAVFVPLAWYSWPVGTVLLAPLYAVAIARPLMNFAADARHAMRENVWLPVHGEHFAYKATAIRVMEDEFHWRWVCLDDVKKVIPFNPTENALNLTYPGRVQRGEKLLYMRDDALMEYLAKSTQEAPIRFRTWVEKTVFHPASKTRERLGIRTEAAEAD